ncbi:hypothetical protein L1987_60783 [Smallanthus sonchifolius]|uniref:Uncharacterized protein n=1 Tax=Smallanthus sonchifolius TaxID=185202 RepID=A0ACB9D9C3_9ASTR|nr:hypothetical protein L1987_60783 [Smallanthus sonchifolius]
MLTDGIKIPFNRRRLFVFVTDHVNQTPILLFPSSSSAPPLQSQVGGETATGADFLSAFYFRLKENANKKSGTHTMLKMSRSYSRPETYKKKRESRHKKRGSSMWGLYNTPLLPFVCCISRIQLKSRSYFLNVQRSLKRYLSFFPFYLLFLFV